MVLNPYGSYVANKVVNGKQMAVCWHIDNCKVSHCNPIQVTIFREWLNRSMEWPWPPIKVRSTTKFGVIFYFTANRKVMATMMEYIKTIMKNFPEEVTGTKSPPAMNHMFMVRNPSLAKVLPEEQAMVFHRATAQLLFLSARVRKDIQPAIVFLTT